MTSTLKDIPDIDRPEQQTFVKFFRSLSPVTDGTIRLFERDANQKRYYSFHGDDAHYIAQNIYKTTTVIKYWGGNDATTGLATTLLSSSVAESFLRDALLTKQLRIEIWRQKKNTTSWNIICNASPGNLQDVEDLLFLNSTMTTAPVVMAVKWMSTGDQKIVGVSFADASIKQIGVSQFIDNELYSNLESLVIQLGVKECLIPADESGKDYEAIKIRGILDRCGIVATERKKGDFNTKNIEQDLNRLLEGEISVAALPEFELKLSMEASSCLIKYLSLLADETNFKHFKLVQHDLSQYMRLDASALSALNLMPNPQDGSNKNMSLYGLLNNCKTAQGGRLLAQWLKQPLLNLDEINQRQDLVQMFIQDTELRQTLQESHLRNIPDLHRLAKRFQRGSANLQDVVRIYQVVIRLPAIVKVLKANEPESQRMADLMEKIFTTEISDLYQNLHNLEELVESTIDLDAVADHEFIIKADIDTTLKELKQRLDQTKQQMDIEHERVGQKLKLDIEKKLKMEKHSVYGYCFRVGRTEAHVLRNKPEFFEYATQKAGTYFTTSKLKHINEEWTELCNTYEKYQQGLVKQVIETVATYCPVMETLGALLAKLDVIISFAHASIMAPIPYIRPEIHPCGQGDVVLVEARHPCLEAQNDVQFIPNDVNMIRDASEFVIITGPNMGGKSTYIRQIGVISLMAQVGCFVPCSEARLCIFDSILARVGAGDSQLKGVSTFMAEMLETATILKSATSNSLIIIDELGRGTSTYDGFGLAWSISEHIASEIRAFCLFATHFHELTELGTTIGHVKNLNVAVHVDDSKVPGCRDITLLYKVDEGVCDQSFGIHVAELARFPDSVITMAKRKADELEGNTGTSDKILDDDEEDGINCIKKMILEIGEMGHSVEDLDGLLDRIKVVKKKYQNTIENNRYLGHLASGF
ncbi:muts domain V-domain-containing protein [Halteromyces radiatus]|uniref:muts domain V-domain-containing protein n=1 Tax=Halteromyces radiatus TaxID=101107 RepID=UPI00221E4A8F|nr:muts domain V-domain-containing protein [Halteromyces radiatus]KAI8089690.1 muts domain V-domain-containing protein [Halteromyces radiatus]